jgi:hypothetical protein
VRVLTVRADGAAVADAASVGADVLDALEIEC